MLCGANLLVLSTIHICQQFFKSKRFNHCTQPLFKPEIIPILVFRSTYYTINFQGGSTSNHPARPSSPPRGLSSILYSNVLTNDFRSFLADADEDAGDDEEGTRVLWLNFVLSCR